ncbi:MAG: hypothetical protein OEQ29_05470 [Alphaproteobacteria bacterium]|nr:hypothetical protein [Alphaproteobacteria bacterium]
MPRRALFALLFVVPLLGTACTETAQTSGAQKIGYSGNVQLEKVTEAIHRAGRKSQWVTKSVSPGAIEAKREWGGGKHNIVVDVLYDTKTYRIVPKSSKNLTRSDGRVHRAYNEQINALQKAIKDETWNF